MKDLGRVGRFFDCCFGCCLVVVLIVILIIVLVVVLCSMYSYIFLYGRRKMIGKMRNSIFPREERLNYRLFCVFYKLIEEFSYYIGFLELAYKMNLRGIGNIVKIKRYVRNRIIWKNIC